MIRCMNNYKTEIENAMQFMQLSSNVDEEAASATLYHVIFKEKQN